MSRRRARSLVLAAAALLGTACAEPPLSRLNPNDQFADFELTLLATRDTVSAANPMVVLRVQSDPAFSGYEPVWSAAPSGVLVHDGNGVFRVVPGPAAFTIVTAKYLGNSASRTIHRVP